MRISDALRRRKSVRFAFSYFDSISVRVSFSSGKEVCGGSALRRKDPLGGNGTGLQLAQCLGHALQAAGEPGQEVGLRLGFCALPRPEAGAVQDKLAAQVPAQWRGGERWSTGCMGEDGAGVVKDKDGGSSCNDTAIRTVTAALQVKQGDGAEN